MFMKSSLIVVRAAKEFAMQAFTNNVKGAYHVRLKYTQHQGVKGIFNKKRLYEVQPMPDEEDNQRSELESVNLNDRAYNEVASSAMNVNSNHDMPQNVFVIQPYVKWGSKKNIETTPEHQLLEAEALIHSLPNWSVGVALKVPLESLEKKKLFGSGKILELKAEINQHKQLKQKPLTCLFVSKGTLSFAQKRNLETVFGLPVMDRYSVVIQILRLHATTAVARLQVALAEIPYIWAQTKDANLSVSRKQGYSLTDNQKEILKSREKKLKQELERIRDQRKLLRKKRNSENFPIVSVVGYTNAGKTSLIKALTNENEMQPRDQLFATLDVTAHAGMLPCNLQVIYMDTVGFMSDLPTGLLECFVATLEDALLADVLIHVQDLSHDCCAAQTKHVNTTLKKLALSVNTSTTATLPPIINVGNKIDLLAQEKLEKQNLDGVHMVSSKTQTGLKELLADIEKQILIATGRKNIVMRVKNGGNEIAWLYKNTGVIDMRPCQENVEHMLLNVVISERKIQQFKQHFCQ